MSVCGILHQVIGYDVFATRLHQSLDKTIRKFRVRLHGPDRFTVGEHRVLAKIVGTQHLCAIGQFDDLILMPCVQGYLVTVEIIFSSTDCPATLEFLNRPAKGLGDDLMAKTHTDQRFTAFLNVADQILEWGYPGMVFVCTVTRAGDDPAVRIINTLRKLLIYNRKRFVFKAVTVQKRIR